MAQAHLARQGVAPYECAAAIHRYARPLSIGRRRVEAVVAGRIGCRPVRVVVANQDRSGRAISDERAGAAVEADFDVASHVTAGGWHDAQLHVALAEAGPVDDGLDIRWILTDPVPE